MNKTKKILGSLYGLALGDALGAPTELRSIEQIKDKFDGLVYDFKSIPDDVFARTRPKGTVTDDFSLTYYLCREINNAKGNFNEEVAKLHVIAWGNDEVFFENFAGPTTRLAIEALRKEEPTDIDPFGLVNYNAKATNGVAMKVAPVALITDGDVDKAIENALILARPTHYNSTAMGAATAVAAAIAVAVQEDKSIEDIFEAAIYGADKGQNCGIEELHISVAPRLSYKISEAIRLGKEARDFDHLLEIVDQKVGTNIQVTESIPAVFAIIAGTGGDLMQSIYAGVNCGGDTDTIAAMVGSILGALHGLDGLPKDELEIIKKANHTLNIELVLNEFVNNVV